MRMVMRMVIVRLVIVIVDCDSGDETGGCDNGD